MHIVYHILLFIAYFAILADCQGGGSGGGGGGSRAGGGKSACTTGECRQTRGIILGSAWGSIALLLGICCCYSYHKGRPSQNNSVFVDVENSKQLKQEANDVNIFQSGIWSTRYFQYTTWHGPYQLSLSFDPQSMKVAGSGSDDIGTFSVHGTYSLKTLRIGLTKEYQKGTGNPSQNLGHQVTIQLEWNEQNNHFAGKWYVQTNKYHGEEKFELKFEGQHISSVYEKV